MAGTLGGTSALWLLYPTDMVKVMVTPAVGLAAVGPHPLAAVQCFVTVITHQPSSHAYPVGQMHNRSPSFLVRALPVVFSQVSQLTPSVKSCAGTKVENKQTN